MIARTRYLVLAIVMAIATGVAASAQQVEAFRLDPARSTVEFTLGDVLHTVHGTFQLKSGYIQFDRATGEASGELVVDASSGNSGSNGRDKRMKRDILETQKFPEITFMPQHVTGTLAPDGSSQMQIEGQFTLHGQAHPMSVTMPVAVAGSHLSADVHFTVPYVKWGLKNPSTLFLRVSDKVEITVHAVGDIQSQTAGSNIAHQLTLGGKQK